MINIDNQKIDLSSVVAVLKKRKAIILLSFLFFFFASLYFSFLTRKIYKVNFTINSSLVINQPGNNQNNFSQNRVSQGVIEGIIRNFNSLYNYKKEFVPFENDTIKVKPLDFKAIEIIPSITETNSLEISAYIFDLKTLNNTMGEFVAFVNRNEYIFNIFKSERERLNELKKKYQIQQREMDSMKFNFLTKNTILNFNVHNDIVRLEEKISDINYSLQNLNGFNIVVKPVLPTKPEGFATPMLIALFSITGFFIGLIVALIIDKIKLS